MSPTYRSWQHMKQRCLNPNQTGYGNYGGRKIAVCKRWRDSFENFYADMGHRPAGMTLDRKNPNGNYNKKNCRWADKPTQMANRRQRHDTPVYLGKSIKQWSVELGIEYKTAHWRWRNWGTPIKCD